MAREKKPAHKIVMTEDKRQIIANLLTEFTDFFHRLIFSIILIYRHCVVYSRLLQFFPCQNNINILCLWVDK